MEWYSKVSISYISLSLFQIRVFDLRAGGRYGYLMDADVSKSLQRLHTLAGDLSPSAGSSGGGTVIQARRGQGEREEGSQADDVSPLVEAGCALIGMFYMCKDGVETVMRFSYLTSTPE